MWAIMGGSGIAHFKGIDVVENITIKTPFGQHSPGLKRIRVQNKECILLPRHGEYHTLLPNEVNYRANVFALKKLGCHQIASVSAVGSLREELAPGDLVVPSQYVNRTSGRNSTFFGNGICGHVSLADPVCSHWDGWLRNHSDLFDFRIHFDRTYLCMEGPAFSTKAEAQTHRTLDYDIIGMTNYPEYALAREAAMGYFPLCFVTDYDCWRKNTEPVSIEEMNRSLKLNRLKASHLIEKAIQQTPPPEVLLGYRSQGAMSGLLTQKSQIQDHHKEWLNVLEGTTL